MIKSYLWNIRYELRNLQFKELSKLSKSIAIKVSRVIDGFKTDACPKGYKKLKGSENNYRVRIGDYRILYSIYEDVLIIEVIKIAHRKDAYKKR